MFEIRRKHWGKMQFAQHSIGYCQSKRRYLGKNASGTNQEQNWSYRQLCTQLTLIPV